MPIWRTHCGSMRRQRRHPVEFLGSEAAQARDRHAVQAAARTELAGVEIGVRIEPQHSQRPPRLAAMARHRRDRADREAVVAAEQDGQAVQPRVPGAPRACDLAVPRRHLAQVAVALDAGRQPGFGGPARLPQSRTSKPRLPSAAGSPATRSASGPIEAPRSLAPTSVGAPMRLSGAGHADAVSAHGAVAPAPPAAAAPVRAASARAHAALGVPAQRTEQILGVVEPGMRSMVGAARFGAVQPLAGSAAPRSR